jgi:hypothetical protein
MNSQRRRRRGRPGESTISGVALPQFLPALSKLSKRTPLYDVMNGVLRISHETPALAGAKKLTRRASIVENSAPNLNSTVGEAL